MSDSERSNEACPKLAVVEERIHVDKHVIEGGRVRVTTVVREREEEVALDSASEEVSVERRPIDRFVDAAPPIRNEGDAMIVPVMEEVIVVEKRLKLREELVITRRRVESVERQTVRLRREEPIIERLNPQDDSTKK